MLFVSISEFPVIHSVAYELRLDLFPNIEMEKIRAFIQSTVSAVMLTLRKESQGGKFKRTEGERQAFIEELLALGPSFFDLEWDMDPVFLRRVIAQYPETKFVLSYHNFEQTPTDLGAIYASMQEIPAYTYKMACKVHSTNDALKMLLFGKERSKVSVICMGEKGEFARVLAGVMGNVVNYACLNGESKTGPGQLSFVELTENYHYYALNENTAIYGLIGDPVEKSPGHRHHNAVFRARGCNAIYVKMEVKPEELEEFMVLAQKMGIRGLSVTIPLKEKIVPFVATSDLTGAINTLRFEKGEVLGINTDGLGALDAIEKKGSVRGKKVVLLGAGGAARAIAFEAKARGALLLILNRTVQRALDLAKELGCEGGSLSDVPPDYDILINSSPEPMPIAETWIRPETIAMDVVYSPRETLFLRAALDRGCRVVYGEEMYLNQAARQTAFWLDK
jgi:3-dehydroquinate dehydratase/shikimate dehydrogenase